MKCILKAKPEQIYEYNIKTPSIIEILYDDTNKIYLSRKMFEQLYEKKEDTSESEV